MVMALSVLILLLFSGAIFLSVSGRHRVGEIPPVEWSAIIGGFVWLIPVGAVLSLLAWEHAAIWRQFNPSASETYRSGRINLPVSPSNRRVDSTAGGELPPWVALGQQTDETYLSIPVHSDWHSDADHARDIAREHALDVVRQEFRLAYPETEITLEIPDLNALLVLGDSALESRPTDLGPIRAPMYRAHFLVRIDDASRGRILELSQARAAETRLFELGIVAALLTTIWTAAAIYFRLDLRTESRYRGWLRTAFSSIVFAGALAAHFGLTAIAQGYLISAIR